MVVRLRMVSDRYSRLTQPLEVRASLLGQLGLPLILCAAVLIPIALGQKVVINIDGNWSPWSTISSPCNATCGGGVMFTVRSCTNPKPQGSKARDCDGASLGEHMKITTCNTSPCSMQWSSWSNCSATCGRGMTMRYTKCARAMNGPLYTCEGDKYFTHTKDCNTWNKAKCASPCFGFECMEKALCIDISTATDPIGSCECQMGTVMTADKLSCVQPPSTTPKPKPIPTMPASQKMAVRGMTRGASGVLVFFTTITLILFVVFKVYDPARVIQMNMEISILIAHLILLLPPPVEMVNMCRLYSILVHLFYTTCFMFMFLEAVHTYSLVAFVVKKNGLLTRVQNVLTGWGVGVGVTLIVVALEFENYGGNYHCWLQMDTTLLAAQYAPAVVLCILTLTLIEAAGAADFKKLPGTDQRQQTSARIMQRSNLIIMPLVLASFMLGTIATYEENFGLYTSFTLVNGILGGSIFFFHCTANEKVRAALGKLYRIVSKKSKY